MAFVAQLLPHLGQYGRAQVGVRMVSGEESRGVFAGAGGNLCSRRDACDGQARRAVEIQAAGLARQTHLTGNMRTRLWLLAGNGMEGSTERHPAQVGVLGPSVHMNDLHGIKVSVSCESSPGNRLSNHTGERLGTKNAPEGALVWQFGNRAIPNT